MKESKIHRIWINMRYRCRSPKCGNFRLYGARGIKVCERWQVFENFLADMGEPPSERHSLDRIDVNGNYELTNCRWATPSEQARNRRDSIKLTFKDQTLSLADWAETLGLNKRTLQGRIRRGWCAERVLTTPTKAPYRQP